MSEVLTNDQQQISDAGLLESACILCTPTGSGKTWMARKAIRHSLQRGLKAVYLSPLKAIAKELAEAWKVEFAGYKLGVYTGECGVDAGDGPRPTEADILICTPEKFDLYLRMWSEHIGWLAKVDVLVADELHTMGAGRRGATLEGLIGRFMHINPYARVMGLSATLGNPQELAKWIGGTAYVSNNRPVPLKWRIQTHSKSQGKADVVVQEVEATLKDGGQVIVFVQSRPRTESLVKRLHENGISAAAHHAGLSKSKRDRAEAGYRAGEISVMVATPTLAMGVNLPARKVVLHDLQRYCELGWEDLSTNEVWQLAGRAGRRGLDSCGEVVLVAPAWNQVAARRYIKGCFEPIQSQLAQPQGLAEQILVAFGSRMATKKEQAARLLAGSFYGQSVGLHALTSKVGASVDEMIAAGMLDQSDTGSIRATRLGRIANRFQLTAKTVITWKRLEDELPQATLFDLLVSVCASPDFTSKLRADHDDVPVIQAALDGEAIQMRGLALASRKRLLGTSGRDLVCAIRTALVLRAWTRLGDIDEAAQMFGAQEHEAEEARREAVRLLQAFSAMLSCKPRQVVGDGIEDEAGLAEKAGALCAMVGAGLDDEGATLALIDGVGPVMARRLVRAGYTDIEVLAQADAAEVCEIEGISDTRADNWIAQAEEIVSKGGAYRYREVCRDVPVARHDVGLTAGLDFYRWQRASSLVVTPEGPNWMVTGGSEAHAVSGSLGHLSCDCEDARKGRMCKHKIAVGHLLGDTGIPRFDEGFPVAGEGMDLEVEWSASMYGGVSNWR